ncbi:hypothetical protein [Craterilacuibacter sp.]|uniref:hypothetical protein n=1 Tax=Craterilacuibacter sp. TaxID=2870909 RepID=UPI003F2A4EB0
MDKAYLEVARQAYLQLLAGKGAQAQVLARRRRLLEALNTALQGLPLQPGHYRQAVDGLLAQCEAGEHPAVLAMAREYYYFWLGDVARLARVNARSDFFTTHHLQLPLAGSLIALQAQMEQSGFNDFPPSLAIYLGELYENDANAKMQAECEMLIKLLLFLLRDQPHHPDSYRMAVDGMLLQLEDEVWRNDLLQVTREFFYYWLTFPRASVRG